MRETNGKTVMSSSLAAAHKSKMATIKNSGRFKNMNKAVWRNSGRLQEEGNQSFSTRFRCTGSGRDESFQVGPRIDLEKKYEM